MITTLSVGASMPTYSEKGGSLDITNSFGWGAGFSWGVDLGAVEILPEIWFRQSYYDLYNSGVKESYDVVANTIEVPIIGAIKIGALRLNLGPVLSLMDNNNGTSTNGKSSVELGRTRSAAGYLVGLSGVIASHIVVDLRFVGSFASVDGVWYDSKYEAYYKYSYRSFNLNVGYRF